MRPVICLILFLFSACAGAGQTEFIDLPANLPSAVAPKLANPPGQGLSAGPATYTFWIKNRRATAPAGLAAYTQITAQKLSWSAHFVLYRDQSAAAYMTPAQASTFVTYLEGKYAQMQQVYGDGIFPDLQQTGRVVILAQDIEDDYASLGSTYVAGYFAPRDLFNDAYTSALFSDVALIQSVSAEVLAERSGRSNMLPMIYADLKPFFNAEAFGGDTAKAQNVFREMLLHEVSHLFTYYSRHVARNLPSLPKWLAEGLAENAPMFIDGRFESMKGRLADFSDPIVQAALKTPVSIGQFGQNNSERAGYVRANLFFNYLRHRMANTTTAGTLYRQIVAGGADLVSLENLISANGISPDLSSFYYDFVISLYAASGGYEINSFQDFSGTPRNLNTGSPLTLKQTLGFSAAGINKYNQGGIAFMPALNQAPIPQAYAAQQCLPPLSFQIYPYYTLSGESFSPAALGADTNLKFLVAYNPDTQFSNTDLRQYNSGDTINLAASNIAGGVLQNFYHIIIINDKLSGNCLSPGNLPRNINEGNLTAWLGAGLNGWQGDPGATNGNTAPYFLRTAGMATNLTHTTRTANYVFVADYLGHKISRWNINTGAFAGAIGDLTLPSLNTGCAADSSAADGFKMTGRTYQNFCRRSLNSPRGVTVTSRGDILIADTDNHRLVLYDAAGNFIAWLGDPASDLWQCASGSAHPYCAGAGTGTPVSAQEMPTAAVQTNMFYYPWHVSVDETGATKYIYVTGYGSSRVMRRNLETGAFAGIVGNGHDGWLTATATLAGIPGTAKKYLNSPTGITHDETYIYVADTNNHRISRYTKAGVQSDILGDTTKVFLGGGVAAWHDGATPSGSAELALNFPSGVTLSEFDGLDGNSHRFLTIADTGNHRLSRFALRFHQKTNPANVTWNLISKGWLGAGFLTWQSGANTFDYAGISASQLFPPEFIYSPQATLFIPASASGLQRDYFFITTTYSARVSRWNANCLWQQSELTTFTRNCGGEP